MGEGRLEPWDMTWMRLPLEGMVNVREIGGYPTADGRQTAYHQFLRADRLCLATPSDLDFLDRWGVRTVIDLRGDGEVEREPDLYVDRDGVDYFHDSLLSRNAADPAVVEEMMSRGEFTMRIIYDTVIHNREGMRSVFGHIAAARPGVVLFHCAEGKDRTGMVAMLLMSLAGCSREDCVANYVQSRPNLMARRTFAEYWNTDPEGHQFLDTPPELIGRTMDYVLGEFGSAEAYLLDCGVTPDELEAVRARVMGETGRLAG